MDPTFEVKIGSKLQDWFLELGVFSLVGTAETWGDNDATLVPLYILYLGPTIGSLDFGVSLV